MAVMHVQIRSNWKTGIHVWTTTGTLLSRNAFFFSGKVLAGANSKSNRTNFLLRSSFQRVPPEDTPLCPTGLIRTSLDRRSLLCTGYAHVWDSTASNANQLYGSKPCSRLPSCSTACLSESTAPTASSSVGTLRDSTLHLSSMGL